MKMEILVKRWTTPKLNPSLQWVRSCGIFDEIETPETVYHMTNRKNLAAILADRKIKSVREKGKSPDFMTFFFPSIEQIPIFITLTNADKGRSYYDFDGVLHKAPPLIHAETVILKLKPRGAQCMEWYREHIDETNGSDEVKELCRYMNAARICHYGAMRFYQNPEIIELTDIDNLPESETLKRIKEIQMH